MADYNERVGYLTQQLIKYVEENEINLDNDDHLDILREYIYENFRISITREPIKRRLKKLL